MYKVKECLLLLLFLSTSGCGIFHAARVKENNRVENFEDAINQIAKQVTEKGINKLKICIGQNTYRDTDMSSEFGAYISDELDIAISKTKAFEEISRKELDQILKEQKLSLSGLINTSESIEPGKIKGIDAVLTGTYWEEGKGIRINLSLIKVETAEKLGVVSLTLHETKIPVDIEIIPINQNSYFTVTKIWGANKGISKDLKVNLWVDKGKGSIYKKGEKVIVYFMVNKNCFIRLYHTNANGELQLLFPNFYSRSDYIQANQFYSIPNDSMAFDFEVVPPYGVEILNAVVSSRPFPPEDFSIPEGEVFRPLGKATEENVQSLISRGIKVIPADIRTDDVCVFTTIEK